MLAILSGCQATGLSKWTPANAGAESVSEAQSHNAIFDGTATVGATDTEFEVGKNPYAYDDIPPGVRPAMDTREAGLWFSVDKVEEQSKTAGNRITDPELNKYISEIVCKLSGPYCSDVRVYIQRVPIFNASMYPNGMMSILSGFLLRTQNEAQLVAVLGHEAGHYIRRHSIQRMEDMIAKQDFSVIFSFVSAGLGVPVMSDILQVAMLSSLYAYGRDNEREADLIGINLMHKHGYDAREAAKIWELLLREEDPDRDLNEVSTSTSFSSSHPSSAERMQTLRQIALKLQGPDKWGITNKAKFDEIVGPWKFQFLEDEIRLQNWNTSLELLNILKESGHKKSEIAYFQGEIFRNRNKKADADAEKEEDRIADHEKALKAYEQSMSYANAPPQAYRAAGLLYLRDGRTETAKAALMSYLKRMPAAPDRKLIEYMITNASGKIS
ncbi:MAG: M48 family metallopeptidase [Rhodospirillales bacterium]